MAEHRLLLFFADAEHLEHLRLQIALVDPDAAAAEFHAVEHHVVGYRADLAEFAGFEQRDVFGLRAREGMMDGDPVVFLRVESEQRKIDDPEEVQLLACLR